MITSLAAADVFTAWLNSETWPETFTAERPEDLQPPSEVDYYTAELRCIVLPREDAYSRKTRDPVPSGLYEIDAFLACHVDTVAAEDVYAVAHEIVSRLLDQPTVLSCGFVQEVNRVLWLPDHLQNKRIFGTVVTASIDAHHELS